MRPSKEKLVVSHTRESTNILSSCLCKVWCWQQMYRVEIASVD